MEGLSFLRKERNRGKVDFVEMQHTSIEMQHEERFGREVYTNFSTEIEKFRRGGETYILLEFENAWKFGSLFSVQDADGNIRVSSHIGTMQIDYPKGLGKTYTRQD